MAFRIFLDQTVVRIIDETGRNEPIQYNPGEVKYYIKDGKFIFFDGIEEQDFNNHGYVDFADRFGNTFSTEAEFVTYLNNFLNSPVVSSNPISPLAVNFDEVTVDSVDWEASDFTGWIGDPKDIFRNVNNDGIHNESTDNPKVFILRFKRTEQIRVFGVGSAIGFHSNLKASILGSGDTERGILDLSLDPTQRTSTVYKEEQFELNAIKVEFFTASRIDVTNIFLKNQFSNKKQNVIHKWGVNLDVDPGTPETIWTLGGIYIFTTIPQAYYISSSSLLDTVEVEVETIGINANGRLQREITLVTLEGQTKVLIPTNFLNIASNRAFNNNGDPLIGDVYIYEDGVITGGIPNDLSTVRSVIPTGKDQTRQAVYTVPEFLEDGRQVVQFDLYNYAIDLARTQNVAGEGSLFITERGKVPRERHSLALSDNKRAIKEFGADTPLSIAPGSDVYLNVDNVTSQNTAAFGDFSGSLIIL